MASESLLPAPDDDGGRKYQQPPVGLLATHLLVGLYQYIFCHLPKGARVNPGSTGRGWGSYDGAICNGRGVQASIWASYYGPKSAISPETISPSPQVCRELWAAIGYNLDNLHFYCSASQFEGGLGDG